MKKDGLIIYGGQEITDLDDSIPDPILEGEQNEYTRLIAKLDQHFLPKKNKDYARFKLGNLVQQDDEPMATYYARIREIAQKCSYTDENVILTRMRRCSYTDENETMRYETT